MIGSSSKKAKKFRKEKLNIKFEDVLGCDSAKKEIMEIVNFLEEPEKFNKVGARQPKGALLSGPPGTGKTMLAKAAAAEANVPFYYISGSEFVEKYVGVGAANVRGLFAEAKRTAPSIIFIDEIDAIGLKRETKQSSGEKESTLNQLLVEMDGFESHQKVIIIAATNRPDALDPALKRPGRFDRLITVELPNFKGRVDILKMYLAKIRLEGASDFLMSEDQDQSYHSNIYSKNDLKMMINEAKKKFKSENFKDDKNIKYVVFIVNKINVGKKLIKEDLKIIRKYFLDFFNLHGAKFGILESEAIQKSLEENSKNKLRRRKGLHFTNSESEVLKQATRLSALSPGFSGADLKNLCNEAAIHAARNDSSFVTPKDFEEASERVLGGLKKSDQLGEEVRRTVAIHESGHAVAAWFLKGADPLVKVSIIPRSKGALGFAQYLVRESPFSTKEEIRDRVKFLLGGRVAELLFVGQASTGAHDDLEKAFHIVSKYVAEFGMTERYLVLITLGLNSSRFQITRNPIFSRMDPR